MVSIMNGCKTSAQNMTNTAHRKRVLEDGGNRSNRTRMLNSRRNHAMKAISTYTKLNKNIICQSSLKYSP